MLLQSVMWFCVILPRTEQNRFVFSRCIKYTEGEEAVGVTRSVFYSNVYQYHFAVYGVFMQWFIGIHSLHI